MNRSPSIPSPTRGPVRLALIGALAAVLALGASLTVASGAQAVTVSRNGTAACSTAQAQDAGAGQKVQKKQAKFKKAKKALKRAKRADTRPVVKQQAVKKAKVKKAKARKQLRKAQSRKVNTTNNVAAFCAPTTTGTGTGTGTGPGMGQSSPAPGSTGPLAPLCAQIPELAPLCDAAAELPGTSALLPLCEAVPELRALCDATDPDAVRDLVEALAADPSLVTVLVDLVTAITEADADGIQQSVEELPLSLIGLVDRLLLALELIGSDVPVPQP